MSMVFVALINSYIVIGIVINVVISTFPKIIFIVINPATFDSDLSLLLINNVRFLAGNY